MIAVLLAVLVSGDSTAQSLLPIGDDDVDPALLQPLAIKVTAVDKATGEPLEGVKAILTSYVKRQRYKRVQQTDATGGCRIALPKSGEMRYLAIRGEAAGYVPIYHRWDGQSRKLEAPDEVRLEFEPSMTIGGVVRDEAGEPIEGVQVEIHMPVTTKGIANFVYNITNTRTDAEGRWQTKNAPLDLSDLNISFKHEDYHRAHAGHRGDYEPLKKFEHVTVMKQGPVIRGLVLSESGEPIAGARLLHGADRFGSDLPKAITGDDGTFMLRNCKTGVVPVTVQADGYAPDLQIVSLADGQGGFNDRRGTTVTATQPRPDQARAAPAPAPVEFRLKPAAQLRGRLVDPEGNPIPGAFVAADTWREHRSLDWRVSTDADGRFSWDNAPHDEVQYDMGQQGYVSIRNRVIPADGQEHTLVMQPEVTIAGTVKDAASGESIQAFRIVTGYRWRTNSQFHWPRENFQEFTRGKFELRFDEPQFETQLRIEAEGYKPLVTEPFHIADGDRSFDLKIETGSPLVGTVVNDKGEPLEGAALIVMNKENRYLNLSNGRLGNRTRHNAMTGADGAFRLPEPSGPIVVYAHHSSGEAFLLTNRLGGELPPIKIRRHGRVRGRLMIGDRPAAGETVTLSPVRLLRGHTTEPLSEIQVDLVNDPSAGGAAKALKKVANAVAPAAVALAGGGGSPAKALLRDLQLSTSYNLTTTTDERGRFVFNRVPAGTFSVSRMLVVSYGNMWTNYPAVSTRGEVTPGAVVDLQIGGVGRAVIGKINPPADPPEGFSWAGSDAVRMRTGPKFGAQAAYLNGLVQNDGSFRIDDVPPGIYELTFDARDMTGGVNRWQAPSLGYLRQQVTVRLSESEQPWSPEPHDLGTVDLIPPTVKQSP